MPAPGKSVLVAAERRGGESMVTLSRSSFFTSPHPLKASSPKGPGPLKPTFPRAMGLFSPQGLSPGRVPPKGGKRPKGILHRKGCLTLSPRERVGV